MSEIKHILQQITALSEVPDASVLKRLIDELRAGEKEPALANEKLQELIDICDYTLIELDRGREVCPIEKQSPTKREAKFYQLHKENLLHDFLKHNHNYIF